MAVTAKQNTFNKYWSKPEERAAFIEAYESHGYPALTESDDVSRFTEAVLKYQIANGFSSQDGYYGPETKKAMENDQSSYLTNMAKNPAVVTAYSSKGLVPAKSFKKAEYIPPDDKGSLQKGIETIKPVTSAGGIGALIGRHKIIVGLVVTLIVLYILKKKGVI